MLLSVPYVCRCLHRTLNCILFALSSVLVCPCAYLASEVYTVGFSLRQQTGPCILNEFHGHYFPLKRFKTDYRELKNYSGRFLTARYW